MKIQLYQIALTSLIFESITDYNKSYKKLLESTAYSLDLNKDAHRSALLKWLNDWGCRNFKKDHHRFASQEILDWYNENEQLLSNFDKNIWELTNKDFEGTSIIFETLLKKTASKRKRGNKDIIVRIGPTSVSKILFALRPKTFIPWDAEMRKNFNLKGDQKDYLKYLKISIEIANGLAEQCNKNGFKLEDFPSKISKADSTIPKLIDEYFWVTLTRGCTLPEKKELLEWLYW